MLRILNPLRLDPTRTTSLRNRFAADMERRFNTLSRDIHQLVAVEDALGLALVRSSLTANNRWAFETNEQKLRSFRSWLRYQTAQGILETDARDPTRPWTAEYIFAGYKKGAERAFTDTTKGRGSATDKEALFNSLTVGTVSQERLRLLYARSFEDLKGINYKMSIQISKILASGLVLGLNPNEVARQLTEEVGLSKGRAVTLARTELIAAYSEAQLDSFEKLGVDEVGAQVEWSTAGDHRVCPRCARLEGAIFTIREARGKIPLHPRCRCSWNPILETDAEAEDRRGRMAKAVKKSRRKAG